MVEDFSTPTAEAFSTLHEMFLSALAAGFTEDQAIRLLGQWLVLQPPPQGS